MTGWYFEWVDFHRKATAANTDAVAALVVNESTAVEVWEATRDELMQCTRRLIASHRTPKFPNEHTDAIGMELVALRKERDRAGFMVPVVPVGLGDCSERCDGGLIYAPLPSLVNAGKTGRDLARQTCMVICDVCQRGKAEVIAQDRYAQTAAPVKEEAWKKKKLMTLTQYIQRCKGVDAITMLREYEAESAAAIRSYRGEYIHSIPALAAMLRVPYRDRPRGPESITE